MLFIILYKLFINITSMNFTFFMSRQWFSPSLHQYMFLYMLLCINEQILQLSTLYKICLYWRFWTRLETSVILKRSPASRNFSRFETIIREPLSVYTFYSAVGDCELLMMRWQHIKKYIKSNKMDLKRNHYCIKDLMCLGMTYATENIVECIYIYIYESFENI